MNEMKWNENKCNICDVIWWQTTKDIKTMAIFLFKKSTLNYFNELDTLTVSQIWSLICLLSMVIMRAPNSTPMVRSCTGWNLLSVNCSRRQDFPTPGKKNSVGPCLMICSLCHAKLLKRWIMKTGSTDYVGYSWLKSACSWFSDYINMKISCLLILIKGLSVIQPCVSILTSTSSYTKLMA